jgi:hypothetical protein
MADIDGRGRVRLTDGVGANYAPAWSTEGRIFFTSSRNSGTTSDNESIWSVVPLRAPLAAQEEMPEATYGRTDEQRADELRGDEPGEAETVGYPGDEP